MKIDTPGTIYIIAAPSGGGKTSLVKQLLTRDDNLAVSISHTTRAMRPGEIDKKNYYFVAQETFQHMIARNEFLEYAQVFNHWYGTSKEYLVSQLQQGVDVILDIDWQGARQVKNIFAQVVAIFILPPSYDTLLERLRGRNQDDEATISARMAQAKQEISHCNEFDYLLINDDFERCVHELSLIVQAQRLRFPYQSHKHADLLSKLLGS